MLLLALFAGLFYSCLENPMHRRSLVGYSPQGHRVGHNGSDSAHRACTVYGTELSSQLTLMQVSLSLLPHTTLWPECSIMLHLSKVKDNALPSYHSSYNAASEHDTEWVSPHCQKTKILTEMNSSFPLFCSRSLLKCPGGFPSWAFG